MLCVLFVTGFLLIFAEQNLFVSDIFCMGSSMKLDPGLELYNLKVVGSSLCFSSSIYTKYLIFCCYDDCCMMTTVRILQ